MTSQYLCYSCKGCANDSILPHVLYFGYFYYYYFFIFFEKSNTYITLYLFSCWIKKMKTLDNCIKNCHVFFLKPAEIWLLRDIDLVLDMLVCFIVYHYQFSFLGNVIFMFCQATKTFKLVLIFFGTWILSCSQNSIA